MPVKIFVSRDRRGLGRPETRALVTKAIRTALLAEGIDELCRIDVLLCDDDAMREINYEQRGIDSATDVLSFPQNELLPGAFDSEKCETDPETGAVFLGDMVISIPRCEKQGEDYGHGYGREVSYLAVHSVLHLLGYDHVDEGEEKKLMRSREKKIMERLGMKDI